MSLTKGNPLSKPLPISADFWKEKAAHHGHVSNATDAADLDEVIVIKPKPVDAQERQDRLRQQLELIQPAVKQVRRKLMKLNVNELNFTAIEWEIENELEEPNDRKGRNRGARGLPAFLGNAVKLLDFKTVVTEIETSIMTSVSCSACKAGENQIDALWGLRRKMK